MPFLNKPQKTAWKATNMVEATANKIKRPDVSNRLSERKTLVEQCVKCALPSRLAPAWDPRLRAILQDEIERQVLSTSEITVRGSFLVNEVLLHCLRQECPLPVLDRSFFNACFLQGLKKGSARVFKSDFSIVQDVFENEFYDYPHIQRNRGDCQAITIAAARYSTNFKTSVLHSFLTRQKGFIGTWLAQQQRLDKQEGELKKNLKRLHDDILKMDPYDAKRHLLEKKIMHHEEEIKTRREMFKNRQRQWDEVSAFTIQCAINGWKDGSQRPRTRKRKRHRNDEDEAASPIPTQVPAFIAQERALLGNPTDFEITGKTNLKMLLRYLFHILEFYREHGVGSGFSLAPVCQIKRHFMTIDTTVLYELLKNVATKAESGCPEWLVPVRNKSLKELFQDSSLVDSLWRTTFNLDGLRRRRKFGRQIDTDGVSMVAHFNVTFRKRDKHTKRLRQRQAAQQASARVIAIDPGRSNLVTAFDSANSRITTLTRRAYYHKAGIAKATTKVAQWELPLRGVVASLSKTSIRTSSARLAYEYRQIIVRNYDHLWQHRAERKRAKNSVAVYAGKQRVLDGFFANLKVMADDGRPVVVAYGAATFHPTGKGEVSVPVKRVLKVCRRHMPTTLVNEYLTTQVHHACHQRLNPVSRVSEKRYPIRGLCWCQTCSKFVSRDGNAARNILRVYRSMAREARRPHDLRFGQPKQTMEVIECVAAAG